MLMVVDDKVVIFLVCNEEEEQKSIEQNLHRTESLQEFSVKGRIIRGWI